MSGAEEWREVKRLDDDLSWEVSNLGRVRSVRILAQSVNRDGYYKVNLGRRCQQYVHRLVAKAFIPCSDPDLTVDHKDFDTSNNRVDNLQWMTQEQNSARHRPLPDAVKPCGTVTVTEEWLEAWGHAS